MEGLLTMLNIRAQDLEGMNQHDRMKLIGSKMTTMGIDPYTLVKQECDQKRHLPLAQLRDRNHRPWSNFICSGCGKADSSSSAAAPSPIKLLLTCSKCKAVKYCNKECQLQDWHGHGKGPTRPRAHKDLCCHLAQARQEFQDDRTSGQDLRTTLFKSWANQHHAIDGSFFETEFKCRLGVLGQADVGFWAQPHQSSGPYMANGEADVHGFQNGDMLLETRLPSLKQGWKVLTDTKNAFPPNTQSSVSSGLTPLPSDGLFGWEDYCKYRPLDPTSIAPLLLTNVLTVYQMIYHELQLTQRDDDNTTKGSKNKSLVVYFLGAENELNFIPLFGELAFLLPGIDLKLVMISPSVKSICDKAATTTHSSKSLLHNCVDHTVLDVQDNTAGGGRVRVKLDAHHAYLHDYDMSSASTEKPDAVIGLNAGLGSYPSWNGTIAYLLRHQIPFCFSEPTKLSLWAARTSWFPKLMDRVNHENKSYPQHHSQYKHIDKELALSYLTIKLNPL